MHSLLIFITLIILGHSSTTVDDTHISLDVELERIPAHYNHDTTDRPEIPTAHVSWQPEEDYFEQMPIDPLRQPSRPVTPSIAPKRPKAIPRPTSFTSQLGFHRPILPRRKRSNKDWMEASEATQLYKVAKKRHNVLLSAFCFLYALIAAAEVAYIIEVFQRDMNSAYAIVFRQCFLAFVLFTQILFNLGLKAMTKAFEQEKDMTEKVWQAVQPRNCIRSEPTTPLASPTGSLFDLNSIVLQEATQDHVDLLAKQNEALATSLTNKKSQGTLRALNAVLAINVLWTIALMVWSPILTIQTQGRAEGVQDLAPLINPHAIAAIWGIERWSEILKSANEIRKQIEIEKERLRQAVTRNEEVAQV